MNIACRKRGFPIECPGCGARAGRPNGVRPALAKGRMQQVRCLACGKSWSIPLGALEPLFSGQRIHLRIDRLVQAFALIVLCVPMCRVERLVGIKAETIKAKLLSVLHAGLSDTLKLVLGERFKIPGSYLSDFNIIIVGEEMGRADFLDWSKELRRADNADKKACARLASRILGRVVKVSEITAGRAR